MNRPIWNTFLRDPRNMIGDSVLTGRESLYRNRVIECCRDVQHVTLTRHIVPVRRGRYA